VDFWKASRSEEGGADPAGAPWVDMGDQMEERDDLAKPHTSPEKALQYVRTKTHVSASLLQRQLRIGYPRAARLMEQLEEMGAVGPDKGGRRSREVLFRAEGSAAEEGVRVSVR
jgi:S-DNA-T family DNA segregation ATPase FtsK/SpoIIIE